MIAFSFDVDVARPIDDVFGYLTDPANLPEWQGTAEVTQLTSGPFGKGTRLRETHLLMGRRVESITEITEYEPNRRFAVDVVSGQLPLHGRWELGPVAGGTRIHFTAEGRGTGRLARFEPLLAAMVRRRFRSQHARLKRLLEKR